MRIVNGISDFSQVCGVRSGNESVACPAASAHRELWALRDRLRETLVAMGSRSDLEGHNIAPWPDVDRLKEVAAKCGDRTPEQLQAQCEEMACELDMTPGDALDYVGEMAS